MSWLAFLVTWLLNGVGLYVTAAIVPGVRVTSFGGAAVGALVLGIVSAVVRPILLLLSLPITILTLGLFLLVVVGISFWLAAKLAPGFEVDGLLPGILGAIVLWIVNWSIGLLAERPIGWW